MTFITPAQINTEIARKTSQNTQRVRTLIEQTLIDATQKHVLVQIPCEHAPFDKDSIVKALESVGFNVKVVDHSIPGYAASIGITWD